GSRINVAVVIVLRAALPPSSHADGGAIKPSDVLLQSSSISAVYAGISTLVFHKLPRTLHSSPEPVGWHPNPPSVFNMVASWEIQLLIVQPPWRIDMCTSYPVFIVPFPIYHIRKYGTPAGTRRIMEVSSHHATAITEAVG